MRLGKFNPESSGAEFSVSRINPELVEGSCDVSRG